MDAFDFGKVGTSVKPIKARCGSGVFEQGVELHGGDFGRVLVPDRGGVVLVESHRIIGLVAETKHEGLGCAAGVVFEHGVGGALL